MNSYLCPPFRPMAEVYPSYPIECGAYRIEPFEVSQEEAEFTRMRASWQFSYRGMRHLQAGRYVRLSGPRGLEMSDTPDERLTNLAAVRAARGKVLIAGLGIGMVLLPMLGNLAVERVTVIEKSPDVISLVMAYLPYSDKLEVIEADIFEWRPARGTVYDLIYFDIWPTVSGDNYAGMVKLHRAFGRYRHPVNGERLSWQYDRMRYLEKGR